MLAADALNDPEIAGAILRSNFTCFITKCFETLNPGVKFQDNWHISLIAEYLEAVRKREISRLVINMPPRSLKSLCVSAAWPAWLLGLNPASRILAASYSHALSLKHSTECRHILHAPWYRELFYKTEIMQGENEKHKFVTTQRGYRYCTSIHGSVTGEGGNFLIIDDPLTPEHAMNSNSRTMVNEWFDHTFSSRLDDKHTGVIVLVMQRLHENDLSGHLLAKGGWEHLSLPAIASGSMNFSRGGVHKLFSAGETLHELRENAELIERAKQDLGTSSFAAQYLQAPLPESGTVIKAQWLKRYKEIPVDYIRRVQSWDTGIKAGPYNDASVCATFLQTKEGYYLQNISVFKAEYPDLKRAFLQLADAWEPDAILLEDKGSGQQLLQDMKRETALPVIGIMPLRDKLSRLVAVSPIIESGHLFLPEHASWLPDFENELLSFPSSAHDDQVDALTQFLTWVHMHQFNTISIRKI